jgi:hypothetical protein
MARVSGVDLCSLCRKADPTESLAALGIPVEWDTRLMRFSAGLGIPGLDADFRFKCVPELWYHKLIKMVTGDIDIGEPAFDNQIYVRSSDAEAARTLLKNEGVQAALLAMLTGVRVNELAGNHVTLAGPTLTISTRPLGGLPPERITELKVETAVLAIHLHAQGTQ